MANRKAKLNLEGLTERVVPAVAGISFYNGTLSIRLDNQGGTLTVTGANATNPSNFKLAFTPLGGAAQTIGNASGYNVTNAINITGGNGADTVAFAPQAAAARATDRPVLRWWTQSGCRQPGWCVTAAKRSRATTTCNGAQRLVASRAPHWQYPQRRASGVRERRRARRQADDRPWPDPRPRRRRVRGRAA